MQAPASVWLPYKTASEKKVRRHPVGQDSFRVENFCQLLLHSGTWHVAWQNVPRSACLLPGGG